MYNCIYIYNIKTELFKSLIVFSWYKTGDAFLNRCGLVIDHSRSGMSSSSSSMSRSSKLGLWYGFLLQNEGVQCHLLILVNSFDRKVTNNCFFSLWKVQLLSLNPCCGSVGSNNFVDPYSEYGTKIYHSKTPLTKNISRCGYFRIVFKTEFLKKSVSS